MRPRGWQPSQVGRGKYGTVVLVMTSNRKTAAIPRFKSLREESDFWDAHSLVDFWDELQDVKGHFVDARPKPKKPMNVVQRKPAKRRRTA